MVGDHNVEPAAVRGGIVEYAADFLVTATLHVTGGIGTDIITLPYIAHIYLRSSRRQDCSASRGDMSVNKPLYFPAAQGIHPHLEIGDETLVTPDGCEGAPLHPHMRYQAHTP